jgi:hypothetical protein
LPIPGLRGEHAGEHVESLPNMSQGKPQRLGEDCQATRRAERPFDTAEPFLGSQTVIVGAIDEWHVEMLEAIAVN